MNTRSKTLHTILSILEMLAGILLTAAAFGMIINHQGFAAGGVTGLSRLLCSVVKLPLSATVLVINLVLLAVGWIFVGKGFAAKTVAVSVLFPTVLELFSRLPLRCFDSDPFLGALAAGVMLGVGSGLLLRSGASCGGFDCLAVVLNKKIRVSVSSVMRTCDCLVILMQALRQPLAKTIYGILVILISSALVEYVVTLKVDKTRLASGLARLNPSCGGLVMRSDAG